jgi:hypothetical protein
MSRRQLYWQDLFIIRSATGHLNRRMTFVEAHNWVFAYMSEVQIGWEPKDAAQRAYDCHFAARRMPAWN